MITQEAERLIAQTGGGNTAAFGVLYAAYHTDVYRYALSILRRKEAAEDVTQDVFLQIWRSAPFYTPQGKPAAWILRIARNRCFDLLRRAEASEPVIESAAVPPETDAVLDRMAAAQLLDSVLNEEERDIVRLRIYADCAHREIAEITGLSVAAVRWKYTYALKKLHAAVTGKKSTPVVHAGEATHA